MPKIFANSKDFPDYGISSELLLITQDFMEMFFYNFGNFYNFCDLESRTNFVNDKPIYKISLKNIYSLSHAEIQILKGWNEQFNERSKNLSLKKPAGIESFPKKNFLDANNINDERYTNKYLNEKTLKFPRNDKGSTKLLIHNKALLDELRKFANLANEAYCLTDEYKISEGIYARVIPEYGTKNIILFLKANELGVLEWEARKNSMISYPGSFYTFVDQEFYFDFLRWRKKMVEKIEASMKGNSDLIITAHGVGGVYAILIGLYLKELKNNLEILVYTFGQPRIGNRFFAHYVNHHLKVNRINHFDDYVPQRPKRINDDDWLYGYMAHEREFWIDPCNDCIDSIFLCLGVENPSSLFSEENMECNGSVQAAEGTLPNTESHWIYWDVKMGECSPL
ncbi:hypothetical protein G9A89_019223 [Geosiphon pyriformis]|nr:hypothetical protein G9A89_019223 [Geosiphon pyriformis]